MNIFNIITAIAVALLTVAVTILHTKYKLIEEELDEMTASGTDFERITSLEKKAAEANEEIETIIRRMEEITDDIGRLDQLTKKDHSDLVDIRERYILWREPVDKGAGVTWAKDYPCLDEGDDNA